MLIFWFALYLQQVHTSYLYRDAVDFEKRTYKKKTLLNKNMLMIDFDINNILNELEDLSTQEKIIALDEIYDQLEETANEVMAIQEEIEEQYKQEMWKQIYEATQKYAEENNIQNAIRIDNGVIECNHNDFDIRIQPFVYIGKWEILISLTHTICHWQLEKIAKNLNVIYKKDDNISIPVSEDELVPKILEILQKLLFN